MANYTRNNAWSNGGTFANPDLLWYAKGVGAMQARALNELASWWSFAAIHGEYVTPNRTRGPNVFPWRSIPSPPAVPTTPLPALAVIDQYWDQCQHQSWFFPPWHRGYLIALEAQVRADVITLGGQSPTPCPCMGAGAALTGTSFRMLLAMNPLASLAAGWLLMLAAMMAPTLIAPVWHIRVRSFARRRARSTMLFAAAYAAVWMAAGCVLMAIELAAKLFAPVALLPLALAVAFALLWQCSPVKQICINRCHAHGALSAFGVAADLDALKFGLAHGIWCVGSCWALMLVPMMLYRGHLSAMFIVGLFMCGERLERPCPPGWRMRGAGRAIRLVIAQARIHLEVRRIGLPQPASE